MKIENRRNASKILQKIYDSEINIRIGWMWDGGLDYSIGTSYNMWEGNPSKVIGTGNRNMEEAIVIMAQDVVKQYPKSEFAKWFLK